MNPFLKTWLGTPNTLLNPLPTELQVSTETNAHTAVMARFKSSMFDGLYFLNLHLRFPWDFLWDLHLGYLHANQEQVSSSPWTILLLTSPFKLKQGYAGRWIHVPNLVLNVWDMEMIEDILIAALMGLLFN